MNTQIAKTTASRKGIVLDLSSPTNNERAMSDFIGSRLIGQPNAIEAAVRMKTRALSRFKDGNKCAGVYYLVGEPGVGKDELMKLVALYIHGDERAYVKLDGGTLAEKHQAARLIGAPTGYKGYQEPQDEEKERQAFEEKLKTMSPEKAAKMARRNPRKLLSRVNLEASKRGSKVPLILVFISEVDKMHQSVDDFLLNAIEDGVMSMADNEEVDVSDVVFVMAGNTGSQEASEVKEAIGFIKNRAEAKTEKKREVMMSSMRQRHRPEFIDRIDEIIWFNSLSGDDLRAIVDLQLRGAISRFQEVMERGKAFTIEVEESAAAFITEKALENSGNARRIKRMIKKYFTDSLERLVAKIDESEDGFAITADDLIKVSRNEGAELLTFELFEDQGTPASCDTFTTYRPDSAVAMRHNGDTRKVELAARRAKGKDKSLFKVTITAETPEELHVEMADALTVLKKHLLLEVVSVKTFFVEMKAIYEVTVTDEQVPMLKDRFSNGLGIVEPAGKASA